MVNCQSRPNKCIKIAPAKSGFFSKFSVCYSFVFKAVYASVPQVNLCGRWLLRSSHIVNFHAWWYNSHYVNKREIKYCACHFKEAIFRSIK